tara:strand:- start:215 stop:502 length:288 start_codon:yes stop_codon:yes gene_type:complete
MTEIEYYKNYNGPNLTKAIVDNNDITSTIQKYYGSNNNWNGKLWKYKDIFGPNMIGSKYYCEFHSDDGRKHWFHGWINNDEQYFNPPLATSISLK